jgi:hypothetical protein
MGVVCIVYVLDVVYHHTKNQEVTMALGTLKAFA